MGAAYRARERQTCSEDSTTRAGALSTAPPRCPCRGFRLATKIGERPTPIYGAVLLMLDLILLMSALFTTPNSITAWQIGADGEAHTGRLLESLEADGFRVLHDRKIPGARSANIDHIVIGRPGIYVVETKSYTGALQIRGDEVFVAGRRKNGWIDEVDREAAAVRSALANEIAAHGWTVTPIICVHRADLPWFRSEVQGVRIVSGKDLVKRLRKADPVLSPADVDRIADLAAARLRPAYVAPTAGVSTVES